MGNLSANQSSIDLSSYQYYKSLPDHQIYGSISIYTLNQIQYASKIQLHQSTHSLNRAIQYLENRNTLSSKHLLTLPNYKISSDKYSYVCGTLLQLHFLIQFVDHDLSQEIITRKSKSLKFTNLFEELKSLIHLLVGLKQQSITISVISPYNLLYDNTIKIIDPIIFDSESQYPSQYYAPNHSQNDVWSLAITFLEMAHLKSLDLKTTKLIQYIQQLDSEPLKEILQEMLLKESRPDMIELQELIKQKSIQEELIQPTLRFNSVRKSHNSIDKTLYSHRNSLKYPQYQSNKLDQKSKTIKISKLLQENSAPPRNLSLRESVSALSFQKQRSPQPLQEMNREVKVSHFTLSQKQTPNPSPCPSPSPYLLLQDKEKKECKKKDIRSINLYYATDQKKDISSKKVDISEEKSRSGQRNSNLMKTVENIKKNYFTQPSNTLKALNSINKQTEVIQKSFLDIQKNLQQEQKKDNFSQLLDSRVSYSYPQDTERRNYICETYQDGSIYEGYKNSNDQREGQGSFYYADGGFYIGQWKENQIHGEGTLYYPCGKLAYKGNWDNGKFQGYGIVYNQHPEQLKELDHQDFDTVGTQWISYEGEFIQDIKEGEGTLILTNGDMQNNFLIDDLIIDSLVNFRMIQLMDKEVIR